MASTRADNKTRHTGNSNSARDQRSLATGYQTAYNPNGWTRKTLSRYSKYSKLYGERKYAQNYPTQPFRFLDLPAEIRNKIYRYNLCFGSIELSAKASASYYNKPAQNHHIRVYKYQITLALRLLRLNKQVNKEAASIFYGDNESRFSAMNGHDVLMAFCRTIGKRNTGFLRKIVEHCPWYGAYTEPNEYQDRPAHTNAASWRKFLRLIVDMGLHQEGYGARNFNIPRTLNRAKGGLGEYTIIIPDTFELRAIEDFDDYDRSRTLLHQLKTKSGLLITLVDLCSESTVEGTWQVTETQRNRRNRIEEEAMRRGWLVAEAVYNRGGCYSLAVSENGEDDNLGSSDPQRA